VKETIALAKAKSGAVGAPAMSPSVA